MPKIRRCQACHAPLPDEARLDYCSERCLLWSFFGVPALHRADFQREQVKNRRLTKPPERSEHPTAYPDLGPQRREPTATRVIAELIQIRNEIQS